MTEKSHEPCEGKAASHSRGKPEERARAGAEEWLAPLFSDSSLWPLVLVVGGCLSTLGAAIWVAALYHQNFFAAAALLGLCWICFDVSKRHRRAIGRTGLLGWSIVSLWALSLVIGGLAIGLGIV
jgi:hypothetical protein